MAATSTPEDILMNDRLTRAFRNRENATWAADYFAKDTYGHHGDPLERARHERHVAAVQQLQTDIAQDRDAAAYRATMGHQTGVPRTQIEIAIQQAQSDPAFGNGRHKDHQAAIDRVTYLYKQLSAAK